MAPKSKAASLTPALLEPKGATQSSKGRKRSADLSSTPIPLVAATAPAETAAAEPPPVRPNGNDGLHEQTAAKAPGGRSNGEDRVPTPVGAGAPQTRPNGADGDRKQTDTGASQARPNGGGARLSLAAEASEAPSKGRYQVQLPVLLDPAEHLELTLAAARSGMSCQEIIVEALARYLADITVADRESGPPQGGPD